MAGPDNQWGLSNAGPGTLLVWLEPWAEEFVVPVRSTLAIRPSGGCASGEAEWPPDHLVIWAHAPTIEVFIDGKLQDSASATIAAPDGLTKGMLGILFAGQPSARLGGTYAGCGRTNIAVGSRQAPSASLGSRAPFFVAAFSPRLHRMRQRLPLAFGARRRSARPHKKGGGIDRYRRHREPALVRDVRSST